MSRSLFLLLARWAWVALMPVSALLAQVKPYQPTEVLLGVRTKLRAEGLYYISATSARSPNTRVLDVAIDNGPDRSTPKDSPNLAFPVRPGELYSFAFSGGYDWADFQFDVPAGYVLKIGRPFCELSPRTTFRAQGSISYIVNLTLTPTDGLTSLAAGYASNPSLQPKIDWGISLGALPNGEWAGAVRWWRREFDDSLLSNSSLSYDGSVAQGIYTAAYADGSLKYIDADNAIVVIERGANRGYWIKFYPGDTVVTGITADTDHVPNVNGATPLVTYEVSNPNPNGSTLDPAYGVDLKRTQPYLDDVGNLVDKVDHWVIKRRSSDNALVMSQADGTRDVVVVATTPSGGQWTETTTIGTVSKVLRTFQTFPWGPEITSEVNDPQGAALTTTYEYHTGTYQYWAPPSTTGAVYWSPGSASVGKLKKITRPDGSWETYSYYQDSARYGQLQQILRPWDDATSETSGTAQSTTYAYTAENIATNANVQIVPGLSFLSQLAAIETRVGNTSVGRVYYATPTAAVDSTNSLPVFESLPMALATDYSLYPYGDAPIVTRNQRAYASGSLYETTTIRTFASWAYPSYAGKLYSQTNPDGTRTSASYHTGTYADYTDSATQWAQTGFTPGTGNARCDTFLTGAAANPGMDAVQFTTDTISNTAIDPVWLVPFKSLRTQTIYDVFSRPVLNLTYVFTGGASFQLIGWEKRTYNLDGTLASKQTHTGELWTGTYVAGRIRTETRPDGTITKYSYNALNQLTEREEMGQLGETPIWPDQDGLRTLYTLDLLGRAVTTTVDNGNNQPGRVTSATYDLAGRLTSETAEDGLTTAHTYTNGGRTITTTMPGGTTRIVNRLRDGSVASVTGTAVVAEFYSKSLGTGGAIIQQTNVATANSPRWSKSYRDWLGRTVSEERPTTTPNVTFTKSSVYNSSGQLARIEETNRANTLFTYNALGELEFSGLDVNGNGQLDLASMDRVQKSETSILNSSGVWWSQTINYVYNQDNNAIALQQSKQRTRLLPYAGGNYAAGVAFLQSHSYDAFGNATIVTTSLNRPARLVTVTTDVPDSSVDAVTWTRNGLLLKKQTPQNLAYRYVYDHFRRVIGEVDPRTGNVETGYYARGNPGATGKVKFKKDAAGNQTDYTYQSDTGRLASETNPLGKTVYHAYNPRGQETRTWGAATYPVESAYNDYGERTAMSTFRGGSAWDQSTWPAAPGTADTTTWAYDPATGTLTSKTDATNKTVAYTYNSRGQLATRTWARGITTTYSYSAATAEQTGIDYSDGTPSLTYTYNRLGQTSTVADATGTRTFAYSPATTLLSSETLSAFFGGRVLSRSYETGTSGAIGRPTGYSLAGSATELAVAYGYDTYGRFNSIADTGLNATFAYTYLGNSNLISNVAHLGYQQTWNFEPNRDLLSSAITTVNSVTQAGFAYANDNLGRRTGVTKAGAMFARYAAAGISTNWSYNARSEVTAESTVLAGTATPVPGRNDAYAYDNIGNRSTATHNSNTATYTANAVNQYTLRTVPGHVDVSGLAPAAATVTVNDSSTGLARAGDFYFMDYAVNNTSALWSSLAVASSYGGTATRHAFVPATPEALSYDLDGNLTSDGRWDYTYDAENRLVSMQTHTTLSPSPFPNAAAQRLEFKYDYLGRRAEKLIRSGYDGTGFTAVASQARYVYDGWNLIAEYNATSALALTRTLVWGLDWSGTLQGAGGVGGLRLVRDYGTGDTYLPVYDGNGNVMALVSRNTTTLAACYEYDAFGQTIRAEGSYAAAHAFRFSTKFTDTETGLVYYGLRYYSPSLGRFINRDPSEEQGGLNLYAFCSNNGINAWDYLGLIEGQIRAGGRAWDIVHTTWDTPEVDVIGQGINIYEGTDPISRVKAFAGNAAAGTVGGEADRLRAEQAFNAPITASVVVGAGGQAYMVLQGESVMDLANSGAFSTGTSLYLPSASPAPVNPTPVCFAAGTLVSTGDGSYRAIEKIEVGRRVQTSDNLVDQESETEVAPETWRKVEMVIRAQDGSQDDFEFVTLMPLDRIESDGLKVGESAEVHFDEMGIHGKAEVRSISACPEIESGPGRVVLSTFTRVTKNLLELRVAGLSEAVKVTDKHPIFSYDRQTWVAAGQLLVGEQLWTASGPSRVESLETAQEPARVYNLEVERDHHYYVSTARILVHNSCGAPNSALQQAQATAAQLGWNGFTSNLSESQQLYYGKTAADILALQAQGKDVTRLWQAVVNEVPGVITDSGGLMMSSGADAARANFLKATVVAGATGVALGAIISSRVPNAIMPELSSASMQATLAQNGWTVAGSGTSTNGSFVRMQSGSTSITFYTSTSGGGVPSAQVFQNGQPTLKIRLGGGTPPAPNGKGGNP